MLKVIDHGSVYLFWLKFGQFLFSFILFYILI